MTRQHRKISRLVRRLRPSPAGFAAAAASQEPGLLLQLQAVRSHRERGAR